MCLLVAVQQLAVGVDGFGVVLQKKPDNASRGRGAHEEADGNGDNNGKGKNDSDKHPAIVPDEATRNHNRSGPVKRASC